MATGNGVLKLETNIPEVIALAFSEGKPVTSDFTGEQVLFSLMDGRRWYVAPFVAEKIKQAGIGAKMPFEVCKRQVGKSFQFEINTHNEKAAGISKTPAAPALHQEVTQPRLNLSSNHFEMPVRAIPEQPKPWPVHTPAQQAVIDRKLATPEAPVSSPTMVNRILSSYVVAFDVVCQLQRACEERGLPLNFLQEEHVRAIAATAFIEANKAARP